MVDVGFHVLYFDGAEAHRAPRGKAFADAEVDATRRKLVQCRQRIGGDRGNAVRRHQHAGAETDAFGVHGGSAHGDKAIRAQHLSIVEPHGIEAHEASIAVASLVEGLTSEIDTLDVLSRILHLQSSGHLKTGRREVTHHVEQ